MSGLILTLAPGESFIVNGVVLENGDRPSRIRVKDRDARVLRCSDAMHPKDVDTAVKQVYYAVQLLITGDLEVSNALPAILRECDALEDAFSDIDSVIIPKLKGLLKQGSFYSALNHLKGVIVLEHKLLNHASTSSDSRQVA